VVGVAFAIMPRCQGLPSGPCPKNANNNKVKNCQGDLFLCKSCEDSRFPPPSSPPVNKTSDIDCALHCKSCAPFYAKLQQQISDLWNAHNKLVAEVTEIKRVAGNIKQTSVKSDEHVRLVAEVAEMKTTVSRLSEEQQADNCSHTEEVNLTATVCKTLNDMNKRKKNVVVTGLPEVASGSSDSDETKRLDEHAFTIFCEENLTVKPALSKLGCRRLGKVTGSGTKPRRLLVHLTSEQNAQDLLSSAKTLLRKSHDHYIASTIYFNPDLTAAEAKLAFEQRQRRRDAKTVKLTTGETPGTSPSATGIAPTDCTTVFYQAVASTSSTAPVPTNSNLSAGAASFTPINVTDITLNTERPQPCV